MKTREQLGGIYSACITAYDARGRVDAAALQAVGAPPSARPEQLGLEQYAALSGLLLPAE